MTKLTIRGRVMASFAVVLAVIVIMAGITFTRVLNIEGQAKFIAADAVPRMVIANQILLDRGANYSLTQELVLQTDVAARERLRAAVLVSRTYLDSLVAEYASTLRKAEDQALLNAYESGVQAYRTAQDRLLEAARNVNAAPDDNLKRLSAELYPTFARAQSAAEALEDYTRNQVVESTHRIATLATAAKVGVLLPLAVGLAVAFACGYFLLCAITRPVRRMVSVLDVMRTGDLSGRLTAESNDDFGKLATGFNRMTDELASLVGQVQASGLQVNASVNEIAATAKEQEATATEIAVTTTEIRATSREISATSKELVETMDDVAAVAEHSALLAGLGQDGLTHMEETMRRVMEAAASINAKLSVLSAKASNISHVVTTITKVADQTNLLSLNAAIEAEKAGEYGRGFAVVATEIRRLADQTAVATYDIDQMVKEIQSAVAGGVMGMDKFSEEVRRGMHDVQQVASQLTQVIKHVRDLAPRVESVKEGMHAQASGAEQITESLNQLSEAAQQTVHSLRQSGQAIEVLNCVAGGLSGGVSRFTLQAA